jgi:hypothetical protein
LELDMKGLCLNVHSVILMLRKWSKLEMKLVIAFLVCYYVEYEYCLVLVQYLDWVIVIAYGSKWEFNMVHKVLKMLKKSESENLTVCGVLFICVFLSCVSLLFLSFGWICHCYFNYIYSSHFVVFYLGWN